VRLVSFGDSGVITFAFISVSTMSVYPVIFSNINSLSEAAIKREVETQNKLLLAQIEAENSQLAADSQARHDRRHHNLVMLEFANNNDIESVRKYLQNLMTDENEVCSKTRYCDNTTVNTVEQRGSGDNAYARINGTDKARLVELADKILIAWRGYTDEHAFVLAETDGEPHNTITPIARRRDGAFELDLVLRNNITTNEHPLGVYHPHAELHNIKKENIGLIEVMGLAVLPARLKDEIAAMCDAILKGRDFAEDEAIAKHRDWFLSFKQNYTFTPETVREIIEKEIGATFVRVLTDAGVYKRDEAGRAAFLRFIEAVNTSK
jgi:hypothetical protein